MKILIFAHSPWPGGAEQALRYIVGLLSSHHQVEIAFPRLDGTEPDYYKQRGFICHCIQAPFSTPHFSSAIFYYARKEWSQVLEALEQKKFDLFMTNTTAILHGAMLARELAIPHITYAHEALYDEELRPTSISPEAYIEIIEELSTHIFACSSFVANQFKRPDKLTVFTPYDYRQERLERDYTKNGRKVIQIIGQQSIRKRTDFAATVAKALILRGTDVRLDIIGPENTGSKKLIRQLEKRNIPHRLATGRVEDPYAHNLSANVITLVCSDVEPYGLTIPESLRRAMPVVATNSGGPKDTLPSEHLFGIGNLDECVRKIESVFRDYEQATLEAHRLYQHLQAAHTSPDISELTNTAANKDAQETSAPNQLTGSNLNSLIRMIQKAHSAPIDHNSICHHISTIRSELKQQSNPNEVAGLIRSESLNPGLLVSKDIKEFNVVPFSYSNEMENLYKYGTGLAIELAAHVDNQARHEMIAFIACSLFETMNKRNTPPQILALGDGLGFDAIRLAAAGFHVDYIDFDKSSMGKIAALNIEQAIRDSREKLNINTIDKIVKKYDALVCLEVIEHVPSPEEFSDFMSQCLNNGGTLYISECFNGVQDKWQTHLYHNEKFSGTLPFLLAKHFKQIDINRRIYGKPYAFKRLAQTEHVSALELVLNRQSLIHLIQNQLDIGI